MMRRQRRCQRYAIDTTDEIILAFDDDGARTTRIAIDGDDSDDRLLQIIGYARLEVGEGIEKAEEDFAAEVPKLNS